MDATSLAEAIAWGRSTALAAMEASLAAEAGLRRLGLVARVEPGMGRRDAAEADLTVGPRGPFHGVPFLAKDLGSAARGLAPAAGSPALRRRSVDPDRDDDLLGRLRGAGLVPFGLSAVPEFGLALTTEPPGAPPARNPWNPDRSPGGSSGGAAGTVAVGIVAIAHATDAAGSIRVPAACCGLVGLKPSRGAVPGGPGFGNHLMGIASEGVLARSVRDVGVAFDAVAGGPRGPDPETAAAAMAGPLRIDLCVPDRCGPAQARAARAAAEALAADGARLRVRPSPDALGALAGSVARLVLSASLAEWLDALGVAPGEVSPLAAAVAAEGRAMTASALVAAARDMARASHAAWALFDGADAVLSPVLAGPAPRVGHFDMAAADPAAHFARMEALTPNACLANVAGLPALVLPWGLDDAGMPVGLQVMGPMGSDRMLLALGARLAALAPALAFPHPIAGHP